MNTTPPQYDVRQIISRHWLRPEFRAEPVRESGCLDAPHAIPCGSVEATMIGEYRVVALSHLWRP